VNALTTAIQEAAWNSTPVIRSKLKSLNIPKETRNLTAEKLRLRRKFQQSRNPHDKNLQNWGHYLSKKIRNIKQSPIGMFLKEHCT
jgi:hypothetical protein